ncbi:hypothetical protein [Gordonia sp. KTR9]|uniref:hypothetical protein n=1 Tax=Gordonia sp. KTR9 TaxID=337191 RepID=UPI0001DD9169|nr:hypothetical protein [Gordonia sp. KTR9]
MDKPIKLAGFSAATPLARQLISSRPVGMISMDQVPMLAVFTLESTTFDFVGPQHIPQFRLMGQLERLIPERPQEMPYGIGQITLPAEESIRVVGDYPFNVEQLGTLLQKGLYLEGFGPSEDLIGRPFEVDTQIDLRILPPNQEGAPPLVIADLSPMHFFDMRLDTSRYELAAHFPDYRAALIEAGKITGYEALSAEPADPANHTELSDFSFGNRGEEIDLASITGRGGKNLVERLSTLLDVELSAPTELRGLREDMRGAQTRADRARANLMSPGLGELHIETGRTQASTSASLPPTTDALSKAAAQLDNMDLDDLDLSGFSLGDNEAAAVDIEDDDTSLPTLTLSDSDPIVASLIAEHEEEGFSFGKQVDEDPAVRARKARQAREASARRARQNQQLNTARDLPEGNAAPTNDNGPQLGG